MPYEYDLFISYSSADRQWALKLYNDLLARNFNVFLDQNRLDVGKPWEPQLAKAVQSSQHLAVLWSGNADASQWVRREASYFENLNDPQLSELKGENRRFIFIMLEGENRAYSGVQGISLLKDAQAYQPAAADKGAGAVDPGVWQDTVTKLTDAINDDDPSLRVPLAVLSMTSADLTALDPTKDVDFGPNFEVLLQNLGLGTKQDLLPFYGPSRTDWHPFQDSRNIRQLLDRLLVDVNNDIHDPHLRFRWDPIDEAFWTNRSTALAERDKLLSRLSVIVIDPLSLYDDKVFDRLVMLSECFKSDRAVIMVPTPFSMPKPIIDLSTLIEQRGTPFFDPYWKPPVPFIGTYAKLGVNLGYERDVKRLLRASLGEYAHQTQPQSHSPYTRQGQRSQP